MGAISSSRDLGPQRLHLRPGLVATAAVVDDVARTVTFVVDGHLRAELQLAALGSNSIASPGRAPSAARVGKWRSTGNRTKPEPKYQSKKDPKLKWTGRGMTPIWMRDEMKGTKLKKDDFLIK